MQGGGGREEELGGFLFSKVRLAPKCQYKLQRVVVSEFRESCGVCAHPCGQGPHTAFWGPPPCPQEQAEAGGGVGGATLWATPGAADFVRYSRLFGLLPSCANPEPFRRRQDCTGWGRGGWAGRRAKRLGCGISQQVVSPGSRPGLNIKGWADQTALSWSPDAVT